MKVQFDSHDEHQKFLDSGTAISDALDANDIQVTDVTCAECNGDNDESDDNRSAYRRLSDGSFEVRV